MCLLNRFSHIWLCNPMNCSPPDSSVHRIIQTRVLEWVAMTSSRVSSQPRDWTCLSMSPAFQVYSLPLSHQGSPTASRYAMNWAFYMAIMVKNLPANAGDIRDSGSIPGLGRSPGGGHCPRLQYSCLVNLHGQRSLAGYSP